MLKTATRLTKSATSLLRGVDSVDRGAARERVAGLRKRYPKVERDELHKSMVYAKCLQAGAVGGVGAVLHSVPGLRLIADTLAGQLTDDRVVATLQSELIAETFALYEIELSPPAERVAMATIAAGQAGASAVSGGIARHLAQQATLWLSGPLSRRALPLAKIATAVASHIAITYAIGTRARAIAKVKHAGVADWPDLLREFTMIDERKLADWAGRATRVAIDQAGGAAQSWLRSLGSMLPEFPSPKSLMRAASGKVGGARRAATGKKPKAAGKSARKTATRVGKTPGRRTTIRACYLPPRISSSGSSAPAAAIRKPATRSVASTPATRNSRARAATCVKPRS